MTENLNNLKFYFLLIVSLFICNGCHQNKENTTNQWDDFVEFRKGNIPLILVAPHGGDLKPQWIKNRDCNGSVITQDQYTLGIALQIEQQLNQMGYQPYMVLAKIHRIKVDLNRSLTTSHCDDDTSNELWRLFHNQISSFRQEVIQKHGRGLLIDIHGHGHPIQRIELGYLITSNELRSLATNSSNVDPSSTSISSLLNNHPNNLSLNQLITGKYSLGTLLDENGFPTVPSLNNPAPKIDEPFFSGGTNTKVYGSKAGGGVDAIQLELNRQGLRKEAEDRAKFAATFSKTIVDYLELHYSDVFNP